MSIDPKKFALLTSAMAASITVLAAATPGCTVVSSDDDDSGSSSSSSSSGSSGDTKEDGGSSSGGSSSSSGGSSGGGSSSSGGSSSGGTDGGSCLSGGQAPAASACEVVEGSATCNGDDYFVDMCNGPRLHFAPAVAAAAIDCLKTSPICESDEAYGCLDAAIEQACDDATAVTFCEGIALVHQCTPGENGASPFTMANCVALAKAMTATQREAIDDCVDDRPGPECTDEDIGFCFSSDGYAFDVR